MKKRPGEGTGYSSCKGVLLLAPEEHWTRWIHFYFIKCDTHEPTSVPSSGVAGVPFP